MKKIYLFDTDGVLVHGEMWSVEYSRRVGLAPDAMKSFFREVFPDCSTDKSDLKEVIAPYLGEWKWTGTPEEYLEAWFDFENKPDIELIGKIQALRAEGQRCYVATNQEKYRLEYIRETMNFESLFDGIYCSAEIGLKKPQKEYYEYILRDLGVAGRDVVYFDDNERNVEVARELGIDTILYKDIRDFISYS